MIRPRFLVIGLAVALVVSACANDQLGRDTPACDDVNGALVIQMQSVLSAEYVPCINELRPGWEYLDLVPKRGNSRFWISSDRFGDRFLEVTLTDRCDVDPSQEAVEILPGANQYRNVTIVRTTAQVVVAPAGDRERPYAELVAALIESEVEGRRVFTTYDDRDVALVGKIEAAHDKGQPLVVIEQQDELNDPSTVGLALPGEPTLRRAVELDELVSRIDAYLDEPSYKGDWVTVFEGGCIVYRFNAKGPEVDRLVQDVTDALGLFPAGEFQQELRDAGILG